MATSAGSSGGDFGFKQWASSGLAAKTAKLAAESTNSRLAIEAIIGMFFLSDPGSNCWNPIQQ